MQEIIINDKEKYLKENYPFDGAEIPALTSEIICIHCNKIYKVGEYKVYKEEDDDMEYICCPSATECDGTIIDWISIG